MSGFNGVFVGLAVAAWMLAMIVLLSSIRRDAGRLRGVDLSRPFTSKGTAILALSLCVVAALIVTMIWILR
jgi:hypothetical protein